MEGGFGHGWFLLLNICAAGAVMAKVILVQTVAQPVGILGKLFFREAEA
jgi:hypothetical protein